MKEQASRTDITAKVSCRAVLAIGIAALCPMPAPAADGPPLLAWQQEEVMLDLRNEGAIAGLNFIVSLDPKTGWPQLSREMMIGAGRQTDMSNHPLAVHPSRAWSPIYFGCIRAVDARDPALEDCRRNWCSTYATIEYSPALADTGTSLSLVVSRLSPGVLVKAKSELVLFGGEGKAGGNLAPSAVPFHFAAKANDQVIVTTMDDVGDLPMAALGRGWLLAWYGEKSHFCAGTRSDERYGFPPGAYQLSKPGDMSWGGAYPVYPADCPLLLLFSEPPAYLQIVGERLVPEGLEIGFTGETGKVLIVPILGEFMPPSSDTERWKDGLPADIVRRCDWWALHMGKYPVRVNEEYGYDKTRDRTTIREIFEFEEFRPGGAAAAPVPPMLTVAAMEGFPMEFSKKTESPGLVTSVGAYSVIPGFESYEISFDGLDRYVKAMGVPDGLVPDRLAVKLDEQVERICEAGHLAPYLNMVKNQDGWGGNFVAHTLHLIHAGPGEVLHALSRALPFLSPAVKARALEYMRRETGAYPPWAVAQLPGGDGARRESYPLSAEFLGDTASIPLNWINARRQSNFFVRNGMIPSIAPYYAAAFYEAAGADGLAGAWAPIQDAFLPYLRNTDWATGGSYQWRNNYYIAGTSDGGVKDAKLRALHDTWYGVGGVSDVNDLFAGWIGMIRLAMLKGDQQAEEAARGAFARTAALRFAVGKITGHFYKEGLLTCFPGQSSPEEDRRLPWVMDEFGIELAVADNLYQGKSMIMLRDVVPEMGLFIRDRLRREAELYYGDYEKHNPDWFLAYTTSSIDGECGCGHPADAYQCFMAHAWIFDSPPEWLEKRLDVPWHPRGDLYYLHKLVETIRAYAAKKAE